MYAQHFGLEQAPFSIAPDPRYLFLSEAHREALAHLRYGLEGGGIVLLTGEIGSGKTTLCRCFLEQLPPDCRVAYIFNPQLTVLELLETICDEFGVRPLAPPAGSASVKSHVDALNRFLLAAHAAGSSCLLVIDEAQALSIPVLEQLRLLTNLETAQRKLLQIVLVGQPELRSRLADPALEQLAQRVIARYHLGPLHAADISRYIEHRLRIAGLRGPSPLPQHLVPAIEHHSGGIPRRINRLCDRALLGAYAQGRHEVDRATLRHAVREVEHDGGPVALRFPGWPLRIGAAGLALLGLVLAALVWLPPQLPSTSTAASSGERAASAPAGAQAPADAAPARISGSDLQARLRRQPLAAQAAWQQLVQAWQPIELGQDDACRAVAQAQLGCHRSAGGLALIRQLDRPGILLLDEPPGARLLLVGLDADDALVLVDGQARRLSLIELATFWDGEFATLWRVPEPLLQPAPTDGSEPLASWIDQRLNGGNEQAAGPVLRIDAALRRRLVEFQRAQGLDPDGIPGPMTLMALNRAAGIDEPRLMQGR